jgi:16S rRNA (cytidine1402-2'-O)-methyltransferase
MLTGEQVAFVSDAGMPAVADPGARLVDAALAAGVPVDVVPGPSAVTCAIAGAGFPCEAFYFGGFMPRRDAERDLLLQTLAPLPAVLVFYESPHRAAASLAAVARAFPGRRAAVARELTKLHQEYLRAPAAELAELVAARGELKGEVVLLVEAPGAEERDRARRLRRAALADPAAPAARAIDSDDDLDEAIRAGLAAGCAKSALARDLAARSGRRRGEVYDRIRLVAGA